MTARYVAKVACANVVLLVALLGGMEIVVALVRGRHLSPWQRTSTYRLTSRALKVERSPRSMAIATTFDARTILNAHPGYLVPGPADHVDRSHEWTSDLFAKPGFLTPGYSTRSVVTADHGSEIVFDVHVDVDAFGRRVTWDREPRRRTRFLAVFGCSFTFGEGVENDETLPSRIGRNAPGYRVYNFPGAGVPEMLTRAEDTVFSAEIGEQDGIGLFVFIPDHVRRTAPSLVYAELKGDQPFYRERPSGRIARTATMAAARPVMAAVYDWLSHEQLLQWFRLNVPFALGDDDVRFTVRLLKELRSVFVAKTGARELIIVLWPSNGELTNVLTDYLDSYGMPYLDYEAVSDYAKYLPPGAPYQLSRYDSHPSAEVYELIGDQIARDLRLREP